MITKTDAPTEQRIEITPHIRVLWGAKPDGLDWTGWAVWDDYEEECPCFRTRQEAVVWAGHLAAEYANGDRS